MRTERLQDFNDIIKLSKSDWTPVWVAVDEDDDHAEGYPVLTVEWAFLDRLGDGKFFRTETLVVRSQLKKILPLLIKNRKKELAEFISRTPERMGLDIEKTKEKE